MKLTKEALEHYWKYRKQIFNAPENQAIINRFFWLSDLFDRINGYTINSQANSLQIQLNKTYYNIKVGSINS